MWKRLGEAEPYYHYSTRVADSPDLKHLNGRGNLDNLGVDRGMILKQVLKKHSGR